MSPLQAVRNYQNDATAKGGKTLFECKSPDCGGDQSLAMILTPEDKIKDKAFTNGACAQTGRTGEQRYAALELPKSNALVSVLTYTLEGGTYGMNFDSGKADVKPESKH